MRYKVITENEPLEVWAIGYNKESLQDKINDGYFHKHMYQKDKHKKLVVRERS